MSEPQSKLSKLPWAYRPLEHDDWGFIRDVDGNITAVARYGLHLEQSELNAFRAVKKDPSEANARLIVSAVNSHNELIRLLIGASHALRSYQYGNASTELAKGQADAIDTALAKVKGN